MDFIEGKLEELRQKACEAEQIGHSIHGLANSLGYLEAVSQELQKYGTEISRIGTDMKNYLNCKDVENFKSST